MRVGAALLAAFVLAACGGATSQPELGELLLRGDEVPPGLSLDPASSGGVRHVGDSFVVEGGLDRAVEDGFRRGAERTFVSSPEASGTGTLAFVGSLALSFAGDADAEEFMAFAREYQLGEGAPTGEELPADGLGEAGYGVHYPPDQGGGESFGYVWRVGDLVLVVAAGGPRGATDADAVRGMAETVDDRVPSPPGRPASG